MIKGPRLSQEQWKILASAFSNIGQAIILFSLAAFFVPEAVGLNKEFSRPTSSLFFMFGLTLLGIAIIIIKKGK
jgi:putative effector of murein hydrolase LrgA (UPF0299 family)